MLGTHAECIGNTYGKNDEKCIACFDDIHESPDSTTKFQAPWACIAVAAAAFYCWRNVLSLCFFNPRFISSLTIVIDWSMCTYMLVVVFRTFTVLFYFFLFCFGKNFIQIDEVRVLDSLVKHSLDANNNRNKNAQKRNNV